MIKVMSYGAEGKEVADVQRLLQSVGSTIKVNGKYTIGRTSAVKAFQRRHNLPVTGKVDSKTLRKLKTCAKPTCRVKK